MNSINKTLLVTTIALGAIILAVIIQSVIRQSQRNQLSATISREIADAQATEQSGKFAQALFNHRNEAQYLLNQPPLINFDFSRAEGSLLDALCDQAVDAALHPEDHTDTIEDLSDGAISGDEAIAWVQDAAIELIRIYGCAL